MCRTINSDILVVFLSSYIGDKIDITDISLFHVIKVMILVCSIF